MISCLSDIVSQTRDGPTFAPLTTYTNKTDADLGRPPTYGMVCHKTDVRISNSN